MILMHKNTPVADVLVIKTSIMIVLILYFYNISKNTEILLMRILNLYHTYIINNLTIEVIVLQGGGKT